MGKDNLKKYTNLICFIKMCKKSKICNILKRMAYMCHHINNNIISGILYVPSYK